MDKQKGRWSLERLVALAAIAVGLTAGTYGIASAAGGSGSSSSQSSGTATAQQPWGRQRSDETLLSGDTAAKVRQLALAKVPGGTIVRVETDADGHAGYEAHMVKADGTPVTVYVSKQLEVVSVETGMPGPPGQAPAASSSSSA